MKMSFIMSFIITFLAQQKSCKYVDTFSLGSHIFLHPFSCRYDPNKWVRHTAQTKAKSVHLHC